MHDYSMAMEALINQIGTAVYRKDYWDGGDDREGRKFPPIKNSPVPFIPCQYHGIKTPALPDGTFPGGNMYPDKSWEGARVTGSGTRRRVEYFGGFNVLKDNRGRCLIPDTPNNRKRLQNMAGGRKQVTETELFEDARGVTRSRRVMRTVPAPAQYTIIQGEAAQGNLKEMIRLAAEEIVRERDEKASLPPDVDITPAPQRIPAPRGVVDEREPVLASIPALDESVEDEQPDAPAPGGGGDVSPPAKPSPAPRGRTPRQAPATPPAPPAPPETEDF